MSEVKLLPLSPYTDRILAAVRRQDSADPLYRILEDYARANMAELLAENERRRAEAGEHRAEEARWASAARSYRDKWLAAEARAEQPAAFPERIVLWSRGVAPNWYFIAKKADRRDIDGMPVYETLDEIVLRSSQPEVPPGYVLIAEPVLRELVGDERMDQIRTMCRHSTGGGER